MVVERLLQSPYYDFDRTGEIKRGAYSPGAGGAGPSVLQTFGSAGDGGAGPSVLQTFGSPGAGTRGAGFDTVVSIINQSGKRVVNS